MGITVVFDHPAAIVKAILLALQRLPGVVLIVAGSAATVVAVPATFFGIGLVLGVEYEGLSGNLLVAAWAGSTAGAFLGLVVGIRLLRGGRRVVLFLRRFGDTEATTVLTYAAARAVGGSFRLVTLADATIQPLGPSARMRATSTAARSWSKRLWTLSTILTERVVPGSITLALATGGIAYYSTRDVDALVDVFATLMSGRIPFEAVGLDSVGAFAVTATIAAAGLISLLVIFVVMLACFPLAAVLVLVGSAHRAVDEAERKKLIRVTDGADIARVVAEVDRRSSRVIAPRLIVLRVANPVWQETVQRLAEMADVLLIDVSEPSDNLVWEVERMTSHFGSSCVFTCHASHTALLTGTELQDAPTNQLRALLGGATLLAYSDDNAGMRRFARALRATLASVAH